MLLVSGCADFRRMIGAERTGPDEFAVETRAPLTLPPDFDLRPPQPGAVRPQETPAAERARTAMENAGPGEPGKQANFGLRAPQAGGGTAQQSEQPTADQGLSNKLLDYRDNGGGAAVEKRETTALKGVY